MRVFLYEHLTAGGRFGLGDDLPGMPVDRALVTEGTAMIAALATDFSALPNVEVLGLWDAEIPCPAGPLERFQSVGTARQFRSGFIQLLRDADWTLVVAPELANALSDCCRWARRMGAKLLNCSQAAVELAADKHATAEHLASRGILVPQGCKVSPGEPWPLVASFPAVVKPIDGAGSIGVRYVADARALAKLPTPAVAHRREAFCPGTAVSVGLLCGEDGWITLPACRQYLGGTSGFEYLGGSVPLKAEWAARAKRLAGKVATTMDGLAGFIGVDMVLGDSIEGPQDFVIEINPRVTTSYVGLRALTSANLAGAMLSIFTGQPAKLSFRSNPIRFWSDGRCATLPDDKLSSDCLVEKYS